MSLIFWVFWRTLYNVSKSNTNSSKTSHCLGSNGPHAWIAILAKPGSGEERGFAATRTLWQRWRSVQTTNARRTKKVWQSENWNSAPNWKCGDFICKIFFPAIAFEPVGFSDVDEVLIHLRNTTTHSLEEESQMTSKRILCSSHCNSRNDDTWNCNAFYFQDSTSCHTGNIDLDYVATEGTSIAARIWVYVLF